MVCLVNSLFGRGILSQPKQGGRIHLLPNSFFGESNMMNQHLGGPSGSNPQVGKQEAEPAKRACHRGLPPSCWRGTST